MDDSQLFLETVEIAHGNKRISSQYVRLANKFDRKFNIRVLNAATDTPWIDNENQRLTVWVATDADKKACEDATGNYEKKIQRIAAALVRPKPSFVCFASYEDQALVAFHAFLNENAEAARAAINDSRIVRIASVFKSTVVFVRTDLERDALINSPEKLAWEDLLWAWLTSQQPPETVSREKFRINIDSQETYDVIYKRNWYWYWR